MEARLTHSVEIDGPVERVWDCLTDPEKIKLWMKGVEEHTLTSEGPVGVGSTFQMKIREGSKLRSYDGEFLAYDVNRRMQLRFVGGCTGNMPAMMVDYDLTDLYGRTRLDYLCRTEIKGFWRVLTPLIKIMGKMFVKLFFRTLKKLVEGPGMALA